MRHVDITIEKTETGYKGTAKVLGYTAEEHGSSPKDVEERLIDHLLEENEISEGNYQIEDTPTK